MLRVLAFLLLVVVLGMHSGADAAAVRRGFPEYDQKLNLTALSPGVVLSVVNGFKIPVKVGVKDYIFQGKKTDIMNFLKQRADFSAIAQTLADDGHWYSNGSRHLYLTVMNQGKDAKELMFAHVRSLLVGVVIGAAGNVYSGAKTVLESAGLVGESASTFIDQLTRIADAKTAAEKIAKLTRALSRYLYHTEKEIYSRSKFAGGKRLDPNKPLIVTLTAYPAPATDARAVVDMGGSEVPLGRIRESLKSLFTKSRK